MKSKNLVYAYKYSKTRWGHFKKMGGSYNSAVLIIIIILGILFSPVYWLINYVLKIYVSKVKIADSVSFCFTANHITVMDKLKENSFQNVNIGIGESNFSNKLLLLFIFSSYDFFSNCFTILRNRHMNFNAIKVFKTIALSNLFQMIFEKHTIKNIIQFNDHGPLHFDLYRQAKLSNAKTFYIQHAPITKEFPPLYHDVNILFSQDSLDKYRKENDRIEVILNRDLRFPKQLNILSKNPLKVVLCPNILDSKAEIITTYNNLINEGYEVLLRKHPADRRQFPQEFLLSYNDSIWADFADATYVVTNESAVTLEGLYSNCICYKTCSWSDSIDGYGFIEKGLILREIKTQGALIDSIKKNLVLTDSSKLSYFIGDQNKELYLNNFLSR